MKLYCDLMGEEVEAFAEVLAKEGQVSVSLTKVMLRDRINILPILEPSEISELEDLFSDHALSIGL